MFFWRVLASFVSGFLLSSSPKNAKRPLFDLKNDWKARFWMCVMCFWGHPASCLSSGLSVLFSTFFCLFGFWENDLFYSNVLQSEKQGAIVDARVCVCVFVEETEPVCSGSITHAGSHCCTVTTTSWNTAKKREKEILMVLLEAIHHLSENYTLNGI